MKLSLVVTNTGRMEGKAIPIVLTQFLIGRDPDCQLRPASALISKRHCAVLTREDRAFVRDFGSTNGTYINDEPVKGECEVKNGDRMRVGPLEFRVVVEVEAAAPVTKPAPVSAAAAATSDDEAAAAVLLSLKDDGEPSSGSTGLGGDEVPGGSTVMDIMAPTAADTATTPKEEGKGGADRAKAAKMAQGNTSSAAKQILEKYMRRPRG